MVRGGGWEGGSGWGPCVHLWQIHVDVWQNRYNIVKKKEENKRIGKTRDLFKKVRNTKGTFHAKMGSIKDKNGMDLTEAKILRRDGKNTQKNCTKKIFTTQIITMV